jgi:hypothetical protein
VGEPNPIRSDSDKEIKDKYESELMTHRNLLRVTTQKLVMEKKRRRSKDYSPEDLKKIVDRNRFKTSGKANLTKVGRMLGVNHETAKKIIDTAGLLYYAEHPL